MKITAEQSLKKLLDDYGRLEKNTFWNYFLENIDENILNAQNTLGGATDEPESSLRRYQGAIMAFTAIRKLPEALIEMIQSDLSGEPETAP